MSLKTVMKKIIDIMKENKVGGLVALNEKNHNSIGIYEMPSAAILSMGVAVINRILEEYAEHHGKEKADSIRKDISNDILYNRQGENH